MIVLTCLVLAGALLTLVGASLAREATRARFERTQVALRQIIDGARSWARLHPERMPDRAAAGSGAPVTLDATVLAPRGATARVVLDIQSRDDGGRVLTIRANLTRVGVTRSLTERYPFTSP